MHALSVYIQKCILFQDDIRLVRLIYGTINVESER